MPNSNNDDVTKYLKKVLKGLVITSGEVSVEKKENNSTATYRFDVPVGDRSYFGKQGIRDALQLIIRRAAKKHYPGRWNSVNLAKWNDPI